MSYSLTKLLPGEKALVKSVLDQGVLRRRMMDMGLVPGAEVEVIRSAPWGGPVQIRIKGYFLAMRRTECEKIIVERIDDTESICSKL